MWWYRWRARRTGVETPTRAYVLATCLALSVPFVCVPLLWFLTAAVDVAGWYMGAELLVMGLMLAAAIVLTLGLARPSFRPRAVQWVSVSALLICTTLLVSTRAFGQGQFLVLAVGLLALAWVERSALFGVVALVFTVCTLALMLYPVADLQTQLVLPGIVLVLGGVAGLVAQRRGAS